jgi:hypothetical protein
MGKEARTLGIKTYAHVRVFSTKEGWKNTGRYYCCQGRTQVDAYLDTYAADLENWGKRTYSREVRCIIDRYKVCTNED